MATSGFSVGAGAWLAADSSPNKAAAILEALSSSVWSFSTFTGAAVFFAIGLRTGFDADASALAVGAGAATGLRPLFGLSSFSSTLNEGFF